VTVPHRAGRAFRRPVSVVVVAAGIVLAASGARAQSNPFITAAADKINTIAPQAVPQQTIHVGTFNGATNDFSWWLPAYCPVSNPNKCEDRGGPIPLKRYATIDSFSVKYEFSVVNRPPNFQLTLRVPDATGNLVDKVATWNPTGTLAVVTFNAYSVAPQTVIIRHSGGETRLPITPRLAEQLGAFVVPHMLISIVYEPPGEHSSASYSRTSTAGTVVSWNFTRTSGVWETVDQDQMRDLFVKIVSGSLSFVPGADKAASALNTINELLGHTDVETMRTNTRAVSGSKGWYFSVTEEFGTNNQDAYKYPGQGDRFVILRDVLFVYLVTGGRAYLAPVAFSKPVRGLGAYELKSYVPPALADRFFALDPLMGGRVSWVGQPRLMLPGAFGTRAPRFTYFGTYACELSGPNRIAFCRKEFSSTGRAETYSETVVEKATGLQALVGAGATNVHGYSSSSSIEQVTGDEEVASITLWCGPSDGSSGFEVDAYFDSIYRTFLSVRGPSLGSTAVVAGSVADSQGRPAARQKVTLTIAQRRYNVFSDGQGNFAFRFTSIAHGPGSLVVGSTAVPLSYAGAPIEDLRLRLGAGPGIRVPTR